MTGIATIATTRIAILKFEVYDALQAHIDGLTKLGVALRYAERKLVLKLGPVEDPRPMQARVLYLVAFPAGKEPDKFAVPRAAGIKI